MLNFFDRGWEMIVMAILPFTPLKVFCSSLAKGVGYFRAHIVNSWAVARKTGRISGGAL